MLKSWRRDAGLTQGELAKKLGWRFHSFVQKAEIGERRVDAVELVRWCRACGADPVDAIRAIERLVGR
jgi:transcriptional regulator with XRE-family HTH domain